MLEALVNSGTIEDPTRVELIEGELVAGFHGAVRVVAQAV
jgi:hypothetical protein